MTTEYELVRDENQRLREQLTLALNASIFRGDVDNAFHDPVQSFVGHARYVVALYDTVLALRDATLRGTHGMADDKLQARRAVMSVAESVLVARLHEELALSFKFVRQYDELSTSMVG